MSKKDIKNSYIYICESPVLNGYKIGYHKGLPVNLYRRYQTPFTNKVSFTLFPTDIPIKHEKVLHRILNPYRISNELFMKSKELFNLYCYMAKCITNCQRIQCYSREKYGFPRYKGLWNYQKLETEEENKINKDFEYIWETGYIPGDEESSPQSTSEDTEELTTGVENLNINDSQDGEPLEEALEEKLIDDKYIDNPFRKWVYKGPKKDWYSRKEESSSQNHYSEENKRLKLENEKMRDEISMIKKHLGIS